MRGVYRHYKGELYVVLFIARDATNGEEGTRRVVYMSVRGGDLYTRELGEFVGKVKMPDGTSCYRYTLVEEI